MTDSKPHAERLVRDLMRLVGTDAHERRVAIAQLHLEAYASENLPPARIKSTEDGR